MQMFGKLNINGEEILVLVRPTKYGRALKQCKTVGKCLISLDDESIGLSMRPDLVNELKQGKVIKV